MKKWIWYVIGIIIIVGLAGGFFANRMINASTYKTSMQNGRTEIKNKQYNAAQTDFQKAAKIKPDSMEANNLLSQTSKFVDAENKFKDYDFSGASESFNDVMNYNQGSEILESRAKVELKVLKQVSGNVTRLEKIYNRALAQNKAKEFTASNVTLEGIFDDDLATNTFYAGIVKEAKKLKAANDDKVVLSKYKAKKTSTKTSDTKPKAKKEKTKTPKPTKATKETSNAISAITSTVAPAVANDTTTTNTENTSDTSNKPAATSQPATPAASSSSNSSISNNSARSNSDSGSSSNYQPAAPAEHHDSGSSSNNNPAPAKPEPKPADNSSQGNAPSTPAPKSNGNAPTTVTPSN
ncbi:hypothetical protein [Fructilactobacillus frigidiflavus]|uniref:hypothetical protein n=1 Tax=Fructilactobacillus frigidiflavus TaxID=3242688 RepID=UPI003756EEA7